MKILLDENLPHALRHFLHVHQAFTVAYLGWQGLENGDLLARASQDDIGPLVPDLVQAPGTLQPFSVTIVG